MIVVCPNCGARYRLSEAALAKGGRLRCAACDHRWAPDPAAVPAQPEAAPAPGTAPAPPEAAPRPPVPEHDEEAAFAAVQEQMQARWDTPATFTLTGAGTGPGVRPVASAVASGGDDDTGGDESVGDADDRNFDDYHDDADRPWVLRTVVAVIAGAALMVAAAGLWIGQVDVDPADYGLAANALGGGALAAVPGAGTLLSRLELPAPGSPALVVEVRGEANVLPSGRQVLDVTGRVRNDGKAVVAVPPLTATLSGPGGTALRWTIPAPVASLPPGGEADFTSNVTGFPAEARTLAVRAGR